MANAARLSRLLPLPLVSSLERIHLRIGKGIVLCYLSSCYFAKSWVNGLNLWYRFKHQSKTASAYHRPPIFMLYTS